MSNPDGQSDPVTDVRERTRREVQAALASTRDTPLRDCPYCGARERTRYERCPACGKSYFVAPARVPPRVRLLLVGVTAALAMCFGVVAVAWLKHEGDKSKQQAHERRAELVAAERKRLQREQVPRHGAAGIALPPAGAPPAQQRRARRAMVGRLEAAITADAQGRVSRGELEASRPQTTRCEPLRSGQRPGDEDLLDTPLGRYSCIAVTQRARGGATSNLGIPFVAVIDFQRGRLTWCKDNPVGAGDVGSQLAFVRLARECTAARGPAFGSGYLIDRRRGR